MRAELNTIAIPLGIVFTRISATALINSPSLKCGAYLRAGLIRVLTVIGSLRVYYIHGKLSLHLGPFITFRPSTTVKFFPFDYPMDNS